MLDYPPGESHLLLMLTNSCSGGMHIACCSYITLYIFIQGKPEESEYHGKVSGKSHEKPVCGVRGGCKEEPVLQVVVLPRVSV